MVLHDVMICYGVMWYFLMYDVIEYARFHCVACTMLGSNVFCYRLFCVAMFEYANLSYVA